MSNPVSPSRQGCLRQWYLDTNLRMKLHSPTEDLCGKQQLQPPSPVNRAKARFPPQQSTDLNSNPKQHSSARRRVVPPRRSASAASPGPGRGMAAPVATHDSGPGRGNLSSGPQGPAERPLRTAGQEARPRREETWHWPGGTRRFLRAAAALAPPRPRPAYLLLQMP